MICLSFLLPREVAFAAENNSGEPQLKKRRGEAGGH